MRPVLISLFAFFLIFSCAHLQRTSIVLDGEKTHKVKKSKRRHTDPYMDYDITKKPLEERGWERTRREIFTETDYGKKLSDWEKRALIEKDITMGLGKDLLEYMYGLPNRNVNDTLWEYLGEYNKPLLKIRFNHEGLVNDYDKIY